MLRIRSVKTNRPRQNTEFIVGIVGAEKKSHANGTFLDEMLSQKVENTAWCVSLDRKILKSPFFHQKSAKYFGLCVSLAGSHEMPGKKGVISLFPQLHNTNAIQC